MDSEANVEGAVPAAAPEVPNDPLLADYVVIHPDDSSVLSEDGEESQEEEDGHSHQPGQR